MQKLDESLINSDVCIKCGSCCKMTTENIRCSSYGLPWYKTVVEQTDRIKLVDIDPKNEKLKIRFFCPQLEVNTEQRTHVCKIYENRPNVCRDYNCFRDANNKGRRPQKWNYIKDIIKEVHNIDVVWDGPLT